MAPTENRLARKFSLAGVIFTLGIVFADIGTSPLYVVRATLREGYPIEENFILGILSCVIWTLTFQTTIKYVLIFLRADNNGEGGIFALFALLRKSNRWIYVLAIAGGSLFLADGIITPAITVVSSLEGVKMINPQFHVIPIVLVILTLLFFIQQFGTEHISRSFGSIMLVWFTMLAVFGTDMIFSRFQVLKAFNPYYALHLLWHYPGAIFLLGAVFLCTTGAEALYTNLGYCGIKNIRDSWIFVKISLILNYLGQGAWVLNHGNEMTSLINPFYAIMPSWFLPFGIIIATAAAIIASQSLINASYTLVSEAISLRFWPRIKIKYPALQKGQSYISTINWFLWLSCIMVVIIFKQSEKMEAAYGLSINITMLIDTLLMISFLSVKRTSRFVTIFFLLFFLTIEGTFLYGNLHKIAFGGWFPLIIGSIFSFIMYAWYNGRRITNRYLRFLPLAQYKDVIVDLHDDESIPKTASNLAFLTKANRQSDIESKILASLFNMQPKRADHYWLIHVDIMDKPHNMQYEVTDLIPGVLTRIDFYLGFKVEPKIHSMFLHVTHELAINGEIDLFSGYPSLRKHNVLTDFKFIIIDRLHISDLEFKPIEKVIINTYFFLMKISLSDVRALGFDMSTVYIEKIPLTFESSASFRLKRRED